MKHLLLDNNIVLDLWLQRGEYELIDKLLERCGELNVKLWIASSSLGTVDYILVRELTKEGAEKKIAKEASKQLLLLLLEDVSVLNNFGFEQDVAVEQAHDLEDAQISLAAKSINGEKRLVTRDKTFDTLGIIDTISPAEALEWIQQESSDHAVAFIDLKAQQDVIRPNLEKNIHQVLRHGRYILGPEVQELEEKLAKFVGVKHCIGVSSGTDALLMCLMAQEVGPGDAVFTTPFTFIATAEVVSLLGATPVFVDIDPATYNIDPENLKLAIKAVKNRDSSIYPLPTDASGNPIELNPKGIIPVDLFGLPADYDSIMAIAAEHNLFVLEDAAQGLGGTYKGSVAGGLGHMGATSFFPAKPLGCYGDGGAIFTDDDETAEILRSIRVHGKGVDKYDNIRVGLNARLHTMQAAILLEKLDIFHREIEQRQRVAATYTEMLHGTSFTVPFVPDGLQSVWAQYSLLCEDRDRIQNGLKSQGIPTAVYYGKPLHLQPAYSALNYTHGDMPNSEHISRHIFSLPMHPYIEHSEIARIVDAIVNAS